MTTKLKKSLLLQNYYTKFDQVARSFLDEEGNISNMSRCVGLLKATKDNGATIFVIGNGGSAAIAEHAAIDFTKNAGLRSLAVSGTPMLTTLSNDYGYENVFKKYLQTFGSSGDVLIAVSSGGMSPNILNACVEAKAHGMTVITLSGFSPDNKLRGMGDINFWVDTQAFGFLEIFHGMVLHWINDSIIGNEIYMIK